MVLLPFHLLYFPSLVREGQGATLIPGPMWQPLLHLGGDAEEVAEVKALVMELVNAVARCWEALPLPLHMGGGRWSGFVFRGYGSTRIAGFEVDWCMFHQSGNPSLNQVGLSMVVNWALFKWARI